MIIVSPQDWIITNAVMRTNSCCVYTQSNLFKSFAQAKPGKNSQYSIYKEKYMIKIICEGWSDSHIKYLL